MSAITNIIRNPYSIFFIFLIVGSSYAQESSPIDSEKAKRHLQKEREAIFIQALHLSTTQASVFHPIYVEFNKEKRILDDLLISLLVKYADNYQKLDHKIMGDFIKQSEEYERKELRVRKKYYKKMSKAISTELASQFYEVDDFISTSLRLNVLMGLPFTSGITKLVSE
jgi:hypothetical protein